MVQAHTSNPCEKLGYTIGTGLAQELAKQILINLFCRSQNKSELLSQS